MRRTERLFAIAEYLRGRRTGVTAEQLAERFEVTVRTIYRDLDSLRSAELPVRADRGRGGGFALDRSYSLPPINFTAREAAILIRAGRWLAEMRLVPFTRTLASALDKVQAALSGSAQRELLEQLDALVFVGVPRLPTDPEVREALEQAWFERQPLWIRYRGADDVVTERKVRVRQIVMERSLTLLNCDDLDKGEARQFRLDRIEAAHVADGPA
ncbi:MAG: HTH domain-containing protein [Myxococcales bacterium]|nr:HTH domain-containing protein [Myxococcales bacterium]